MTTRKAPIRRKAVGTYHHGDLKTALKRAALRLVRDKGPREFSLNEASRLAGVTVGAPYRHFPDKDALLAEIAAEGYALLRGELEVVASANGDALTRLVETGLAYLRFAAEHADYFAVMFRAGLDQKQHPEVDRAGSEAFAVLQGLAKAVERSPERAAERALAAWALVHGLATLAAEGAMPAEMASNPERLRPILERSLQGPA